MKIGLVLGAGGVTGGAYLAGALAAVENDLEYDVRTADVIVGTSAGSLIGALLRSGIPAGDLAAWTIGARLSEQGEGLLTSIERPHFDPVSLRQYLRPLRVPHPRSMWSALRHPVRFDPMRALLTHLADGTHVLYPQVEFLGDAWPDRPFYCCAVSRNDGTRKVFGRGSVPSNGLAAAVAASCAVPSYFAPVEIDGKLYLDGGVASPTNADVLRHEDLDLAIVFSPMSGATLRSSHSLEGYARSKAARKLRDELAVLERNGIPTVVFEPGREVLEHFPADFMSDATLSEIVVSAFLETGTQLQQTRLIDALPRRHAA